MRKKLEGKNVVVIGATSGIGRAAAISLAEHGANVVFCGRDLERGSSLEKEISTLGVKVKFIPCDVTQSTHVESFFKEAFSYLGKVDAAFNNAGIDGDVALFHESSEENWDAVMDTNLKGMWRCMKHEITHMLEHGGGSIVNMSSTSGLVGNGFGMTAYAASKHAVMGLTKSVALEYAKQNIRVNAVCPGFIETEMIERLVASNPSLRRRFTACHPIGRMGKPKEIADAVVYLCSDESSFMTGNQLVLDGGLTI
ncbi:MAG: SDR family NAD(P)-dependent oxidoreductase [Gammaproteobacteria bacterium]